MEHESHLQPRICSRVSKYYLCEGPSNQQAYFSPRKRFLAITKPLPLEQGGRSGGGQQAPALQGEPAEEEGEEGEETASWSAGGGSTDRRGNAFKWAELWRPPMQ